jgi:hypothetical protein
MLLLSSVVVVNFTSFLSYFILDIVLRISNIIIVILVNVHIFLASYL